jgi:2,3-bisphosphoglycerate-dependent phosphoglycerate mutase
MTHLLVLCRHGQSEWNLKNLFTGWKDPDLTALGVDEAKAAGRRLKARGIGFDIAFTSDLVRAQKTCQLMLDELGQSDLKTIRDQALNERDYGELSGLNSYDIPPPGGESLKDTAARVLPYYVHDILPVVLSGKRTLVAAHGNSLRALIMAMEGMTGEQIIARELATGVPIVYRLNADSTIASREELA